MDLINLLKKNNKSFSSLINKDYFGSSYINLDLTSGNADLNKLDLNNPEEFNKYIIDLTHSVGKKFAIGKYNEDRTIYNHSNLFSGQEARTIHLGLDLWVPSGTSIYIPLSGKIHSYKNNIGNGDYGPTLILEHTLQGITFYTLYGHLSLDSIENMSVEKEYKQGDELARVGNYPNNGNWPPHLHFQIISDLLGKEGDFPGVTSLRERERFLKLCPNPNLILGLESLN
jgi:murein DD-endopeptidase MepM/ murein hydrolase activator NlpD